MVSITFMLGVLIWNILFVSLMIPVSYEVDGFSLTSCECTTQNLGISSIPVCRSSKYFKHVIN